MRALLFAFMIACNQEPPATDAGADPDLMTAPACHRCLLDMRCTEGCNALGVCGTPSTSCK